VVAETSPNKIVRSYSYKDGNSVNLGSDMHSQAVSIDPSASLTGTISLARYAEINTCATTSSCPTTPVNNANDGSDIGDIVQPGSLLDPTALTGADIDVAHYFRSSDASTWSASTAVPALACVAPGDGNQYTTSAGGTHRGDNSRHLDRHDNRRLGHMDTRHIQPHTHRARVHLRFEQPKPPPADTGN